MRARSSTAFHINDEEFGAKLERALVRSAVKLIAAKGDAEHEAD